MAGYTDDDITEIEDKAHDAGFRRGLLRAAELAEEEARNEIDNINVHAAAALDAFAARLRAIAEGRET